MGRWWPDPGSYGVDSHPERFAGLPSVALALIEHLAAVYDVEFHKGPAHPRSCYWHPRRAAGGEDNAAASRSCATDVCTDRICHGARRSAARLSFPVCACDAC
ncbi:DUF6226 family protein [Pseudarthrobacter sp. fls2-241-R2A-168]|uniref:DUF6226 family protein n=1 Tax=Pseudarthrobacter sp. fls2-241-R2A-168 TaxID=3040304 RepID=UPI00330613AE